MSSLAALDEAWERWFEREGIKPLRINYDVLSKDPKRVLAQVLSKMCLDPTKAQAVETPTAKLADALSREWRERFESERRNHS
jgi:LPS sulfotransferase NodH